MSVTVDDFEIMIGAMGTSGPMGQRFYGHWSVFRKPITEKSEKLARGITPTFATTAEAHAAAQGDAIALIRRVQAGAEFPPLEED